MAGTGPEDLQQLVEAFRDVCAEALDTLPGFNPLLRGAPDRIFTSPGTPVSDCCEQLAVDANPIVARNQQPKGQAHINVVQLIGWATRCVPTGSGEGDDYKPPKVTELEASSAQINADGWALWNVIHARIRDGTLVAGCDIAEFVACQKIEPSGGCGGWRVVVNVSLDGYEPTPGT